MIKMNLEKKEKKFILVLLIICIILFITMSIRIFTSSREAGVVPLTGLPETIHMFLIFFILPTILTITTVLLFPRIFTPIFLKGKKAIYKKFENAYIETVPIIYSPKKFLKRGIYIFLLTLGFLAFILPLLPESAAKMFINTNLVHIYESEGLDLRFVTTVIMSITVIFILPIVIGLWSIGWTLEDSGLIHYSGLEGQSERLDRLFEIEPIHLRYNSYLKGYAGISSIVFLITMLVYFMGFEGRASDVITVMLIPAINIVVSIPAYIVYGLTTGKFKYLHKGLPEAKRIAKTDLIT